MCLSEADEGQSPLKDEKMRFQTYYSEENISEKDKHGVQSLPEQKSLPLSTYLSQRLMENDDETVKVPSKLKA